MAAVASVRCAVVAVRCVRSRLSTPPSGGYTCRRALVHTPCASSSERDNVVARDLDLLGLSSTRHYDLPPFYADVRLHDHTHQILDMSQAIDDPSSLFVVVSQNARKALISTDEATGQPVQAKYLGRDDARRLAGDAKPSYLGTQESGAHVFVVVADDGASSSSSSSSSRFAEVKLEGPHIGRHDASVLAKACGLVSWQIANKFCSRCGASMHRSDDGKSAKCTGEGCSRREFPRTDPAIITIVTSGDWVLLGRNPKWPPGRYSALAGFLELGETFEQCLAREVQEESGVDVSDAEMIYQESQPWPFPRSLMVGYQTKLPPPTFENPPRLVGAAGQTVALPSAPPTRVPFGRSNDAELADVRWFHRDYLRATLRGATDASEAAMLSRAFYGDENDDAASPPVQVPGEHSLARRLLDRWLDDIRGTDTSAAVEGGGLIERISSAPNLDTLSNGHKHWRRKYVLCVVSDVMTDECKLVVRIHELDDYGYHMDCYRQLVGECRAIDDKRRLQVEPLGGGRIEFNPWCDGDGNDGVTRSGYGSFVVYGYSNAFPFERQPLHDLSAAIVQHAYPFLDVSWHDGGY
ncbi:NAD-capped RNA hydrolase NudC [Pseudoscourfieldia marina]